jgi:hypothetical protein
VSFRRKTTQNRRNADLAVDKLDIMGTLRVAVSSSVFSTGLVACVFSKTSVGVHLDEVKGSVETTGKVGHVDVKGEFLVLEIEHLVGGRSVEEVDTGADVGGVRTNSDEFERQGVTAGSDTVCSSIVGTVDSAVCGASRWVRANSGVPSVTGVAIGGPRGGVEPSPIRIEYDGGLKSSAGAGITSAVHNGKGRVRFGGLSAYLLTVHDGEESKGKKSYRAEHD